MSDSDVSNESEGAGSNRFGFPWLVWLVLAIIVAIGWVVGSQGWRGFLPDSDMAPYFSSAMRYQEGGPVPNRGDISSFGALNPPGVTWLLLPGLATTRDLGAAQLPGAGLLYLLTILGVFLLARAATNTLTAVAAAVVYGWSALGLVTAGDLWPRYPLPCFAIWTAYFLWMWVERRRGYYLALAMFVWGLGMYVFPELAPMILSVPVLWWWRRPPIRWGWLLASCIVLFLVWFPYLRYESGRNFLDVRSLVLRRPINTLDFHSVLCDRSLTLSAYGKGGWIPWHPAMNAPAASTGPRGLAGVIAKKVGGILSMTFGNFFRANGRPIVGFLLFIPALWVLCVFAASWRRLRSTLLALFAAKKYQMTRNGAAIAAVAIALGANLWILRRLAGGSLALTPSSRIDLCLADAALIVLAVLLLSNRAQRLVAKAFPSTTKLGGMATLLTILVVPWFLLLMLSQAGRSDRAFQLWPLQGIIVSAGLLWLPGRMGRAGVAWGLAAVVMVGIASANTLMLTKIGALAHDGWAGPESPMQIALDRLAQTSLSESRTLPGAGSHPAIGYQILLADWEPLLLPMLEENRVGWGMDLYLRRRWGVVNDDRCKEGFSPSDDFRIVETETAENSPVQIVRFKDVGPAFGRPIFVVGNIALERRNKQLGE